jgi:hypothetical protein
MAENLDALVSFVESDLLENITTTVDMMAAMRQSRKERRDLKSRELDAYLKDAHSLGSLMRMLKDKKVDARIAELSL